MPSNPLTYFSHGIKTNAVILSGAPVAGDTSSYISYTNGPAAMNLSASLLPVNNGDMTFSLTNNTTLTIRVKGTDGTVRSAAITLA